MSSYIGLDIGGTKLMVAAGDADGKVVRAVRRATPAGLDEGLAALDAMMAEVLEDQAPAGIGAAVGGPLDWRTGVVSPLHQPAWRAVPLKARFEAAWGCPLHVDVDTNIAALGEYHLGGYRQARFLYLTLSTGMGGGLLLDGHLYRGAGGGHPEVGHQAVPFRCRHPERVFCECGAPDCLEGLVSGNAIARIYGAPAEELDQEAWAEVAWNLGQGLRNLATIYAPEVIVLGGGIAHGRGERLLAPARAVMAEHLRLVDPPQVRVSVLGYDTALRGALVAARRGVA
jgi:predicted NBD/HSP70 family sugar kinase